MKRLSLFFVVFNFFVACTKEIELDYNSVDSIYVIEAILSDSVNSVYITKTRDMSEPVGEAVTDSAIVTITSESGDKYSMLADEDGIYRLVDDLKLTEYQLYSIDVSIDNYEFSATSELTDTTSIDHVLFSFFDMMGTEMVLATIIFDDIADVDSYYRYIITVDGELYTWGLTKDSEYIDGQTMKIYVSLLQSGDEEEEGDIVVSDGSEVSVELQVITKDVYDYFYSLYMSPHTCANPITNFSGGCLGYFSAQTSSTHTSVLDYNLIY
ncbi:MAG: DUF4249 family protein [Rikenellaceae bacterium]